MASAALREVLVDTGALPFVEHRIERLVDEAFAALAGTEVGPARARRAGAPRVRRDGTDLLMRTVVGPTDHVVVVGAGLAGLSAAMRLAGAGRRVTLLEREAVPGGRAGVRVVTTPAGEYRFDPGPTVLTMPDLIADCFDALGEDMADWLTLRPVEPLYRARYADGSSLDVHAGADAMAAEIGRVIGPAEAAGFRRYVDFVSKLYRYEMRDFIDRNIDSPLDLLSLNLARLAAIGGFRRLAPKVEQYLRDPRTQRLYSFQAMYAGLSPYDALALYAVIAYMDSVAGVYFPARRDGTPSPRRWRRRRRSTASRSATRPRSPRWSCGATARPPSGPRGASGSRRTSSSSTRTCPWPTASCWATEPRRLRRLSYSPSCYLLLAGSTKRYEDGAHHTISFGRAWREVFDELGSGRLMSDPSVLVTNPTHSDPGLAPDGREIYYVLFPTPNLDAPLDWERLRPRVPGARPRDARAARLGGVRRRASRSRTSRRRPTGRLAAWNAARRSPRRTRSGRPVRSGPATCAGENVVFAGSGTQPGVGVPMVLVSGRLAAERVLGPRPVVPLPGLAVRDGRP